jgi:ribosome-binding factor A
MSRRTEQIGDAMQRILGEVIQQELKDPRVGFATVTAVEVSDDLQHAQVRVSVMGSDEERKETLRALNRAKGFLRKRVGDELRHMRFVPELHLKLDTSLDYSLHIDQVLRQVDEERQANPPQIDEEQG